MRKASILLFTWFFMLSIVCAQTPAKQQIDSMLKLLPSVTDDDKITLLQNLGNAMLSIDPQKSITYCEEGLKLSTGKHDSIRVGFLYTLSLAYGRTGNMTQQLALGRQAVDIYTKLNDERRLTKAMSLVAMAFYNLGNFEASLRMQLGVLRIRERLKDNKGLAGTWNNLGIVYQRLNQPDEAIKSYEQALKYIDSEKNDYLRGPVLNNLGSLYSSKGKYTEAAKALNSALELHKKMGDNEGLLNTYINFGVLYTSVGKTEKALENYGMANDLSMKSGNMHGVAVTNLNLGVINNQIRNNIVAEKYFIESLRISTIEGFREIEMDNYQNLSSLYNETGDFKKAYDFMSDTVY
jgi:tetratricopeptide (TPR) repeat protein